jgi:hypothetical protein
VDVVGTTKEEMMRVVSKVVAITQENRIFSRDLTRKGSRGRINRFILFSLNSTRGDVREEEDNDEEKKIRRRENEKEPNQSSMG